MFRLLATYFVFLSLTCHTLAQVNPTGNRPKTKATFASENQTIAAGKSFLVALRLDHPKGWHSYYKNSGGVESPPSVQWTLPSGFTASEISWPVPEVKDGYFGKSFVYSGSPVFLIQIQPPAELPLGEVTLTAKATWQICEDACINEEQEFSLHLKTGKLPVLDSSQTELFASARNTLPRALASASSVTAQAKAEKIILHLPRENAQHKFSALEFVPDQAFIKSFTAGDTQIETQTGFDITLSRKLKDGANNDVPQGNIISGILTASINGERVSLLLPETSIVATSTAANPPLPFFAFLRVLGGMLLGGLILNLMPCVFPVIGLKIMGFLNQTGSDRKKIVAHGIAFTVGVFASFAVLTGILFFARATTGWGFQLQDPRVILVLMLTMFAFGLNLFGIFEIGTSATSIGGKLQSKNGLAGTFFSGALATIVATPCSGPLLGSAIGIAISLPAKQFFLAFAAMATGLSLPYLLLSAFPALLRFLPKPGIWMVNLKEAMSFLLFATAGYLLWTYAGQIGVENLLGPIFGLAAIAFAAWVYGRWFLPHKSGRARTLAVLIALIFVGIGIFLSLPPKPSKLVWQEWSQEKVEALLKENTPVYIDFTAQWCATCQFNKYAYTNDVIELMNKKGVVTLKADKTKASPAIEAALEKLHRTAIPVDVLLLQDREPIVAPELLTPQILRDLFNKIPDR